MAGARQFLTSFYYWLATPLIAGFLFFVRIIPDKSIGRLGSFIGHTILFGRKRRVIGNMRLALHRPEWDERQWEELWRRHVDHLGLTIAETMHYSAAPAGDLRERVVMEGDVLLRASLRSGNGAVIFINHLANPAAVPVALALAGHNVSVATNVIPVPYLDVKLNQLLEQYGGTRVTVGGNVVLAAKGTLRDNGVFAAAIDYSSTRSHTGWARFGNAELEVSLVPATIALMHRSAMFSAIVIREGEGRYVVSLQPVILVETGGESRDQALAVTREAMRGVSEAVCRRPEQWWRWDFPRVRPLERAPQQCR